MEYAVRQRLGTGKDDPIFYSQLGIFKLIVIAPDSITFNSIDPVPVPENMPPLNLYDLVHFKNLGSIQVDSLPLEGLETLGKCVELQQIQLSRIETLDKIDFLAGLPRLVTLSVYENENLADFSPLMEMTSLKNLDLHRCGLQDISFLKDLSRLTVVSLHNNYITDISPLLGLDKILELDLRANRIEDLSTISSLINLNKLRLDANSITDPAPISGLANLQMLNLDYNQITDLSSLKELPSLTLLRIRHNPKLMADQVSSLSRRLPESCVIEWA